MFLFDGNPDVVLLKPHLGAGRATVILLKLMLRYKALFLRNRIQYLADKSECY
jgi:hypothetical protein